MTFGKKNTAGHQARLIARQNVAEFARNRLGLPIRIINKNVRALKVEWQLLNYILDAGAHKKNPT